jgi:hypothetical protein
MIEDNCKEYKFYIAGVIREKDPCTAKIKLIENMDNLLTATLLEVDITSIIQMDEEE